MRHVQDGYRGLSLFLGLNIDRMLTALTIGLAMAVAIGVQSL